MKIFFINIADDGSGLGSGSVEALRKKYPPDQGHTLRLLELGTAASEFNDTKCLSGTACQLIDSALQGDDINDYDRIYIGVHGRIEDVKFCYHIPFRGKEEEVFLDYEQLASFIVQCLLKAGLDGDIGKPLNFVLAMCYAARTADYQRNHIEELVDFTQTFAYSFVQSFHKLTAGQHKLTLAAYTGAVGFNPLTGELTVQTEEQIKNLSRQKELRIAWDTTFYELNELEKKRERGELNTSGQLKFEKLDKLFRSIDLELLELDSIAREPEYGRIVYRTTDYGIEIDDSEKYGLNQKKDNLNENDVNSYIGEGCVVFSLTKK